LSTRIAPLLLTLLLGANALADGTNAPPVPPLPLAPPSLYPSPLYHMMPPPAEPPDERAVFGERAGRRLLLTVHLSVGVEPHLPSPTSGFPMGTPIAFGLGGEVLWRGLVGVGLSLYSSEGVALTPGFMLPGLADRVSVVAALALRPLAPLAWREARHGEARLARFLEGVGVEIGPSVEYYRSASLDLFTTVNGMRVLQCPDIRTDAVRGAFNLGLSLEAPLAGSAHTGWVALRASGRMIATSEAQLGPQLVQPGNQCRALIVERGLAAQILIGIAYYL
jgi:hypothetical protein